jgi:hypothetical protein
MSLELLNTLGTLTTAAIIAATAIAAMVQLRHLRASNQINAMLSIGNQFGDKEFRDALALVDRKSDSTFEDPIFREYDFAILNGLPTPAVKQDYIDVLDATRLVCNKYEELGILVKNGIVDKGLFLDRYCLVIVRTWNRLERAIAWNRKMASNDAIWENFEYLAVLSQDYQRQHPSAYPKGVRRLQMPETWPAPAAATT